MTSLSKLSHLRRRRARTASNSWIRCLLK